MSSPEADAQELAATAEMASYCEAWHSFVEANLREGALRDAAARVAFEARRRGASPDVLQGAMKLAGCDACALSPEQAARHWRAAEYVLQPYFDSEEGQNGPSTPLTHEPKQAKEARPLGDRGERTLAALVEATSNVAEKTAELHDAVCEHVAYLKGEGLRAEQVLLIVKRAVQRAALEKRHFSPDSLVDAVVTLSIKQFYTQANE